MYGFSYTIRITNTGSEALQLIARHWIITNAQGVIEEVKGLGVLGRQPFLAPGEGFEYTSSCKLNTPQGSMKGVYLCVTEEGVPFEVDIPQFALEARISAIKNEPESADLRTLH